MYCTYSVHKLGISDIFNLFNVIQPPPWRVSRDQRRPVILSFFYLILSSSYESYPTIPFYTVK